MIHNEKKAFCGIIISDEFVSKWMPLKKVQQSKILLPISVTEDGIDVCFNE